MNALDTLRLAVRAHAETLRKASRRRTARMKANDARDLHPEYDGQRLNRYCRNAYGHQDHYMVVAWWLAYYGKHPGMLAWTDLKVWLDRVRWEGHPVLFPAVADDERRSA